jgi:predicted double-glycine peptidase
MKVRRFFRWVLILHAVMVSVSMAEEINPPFAASTEVTKRHTLKELRDQYIVKQQLDYSCGAAALATLMTYYFGDEISEKEILDSLNVLLAKLTPEEWAHKKRSGFSLLDLKRVAQQRGYQAAGFKLSLDQLRQVIAPIIVYVQPLGYHHFAVLRGVAGDRVFLADPSRGNLRMSMERFLSEWDGTVFILGKAGEEKITTYPLALSRSNDYPDRRLSDTALRGGDFAASMANLSVQLRPR